MLARLLDELDWRVRNALSRLDWLRIKIVIALYCWGLVK